MQGGQDHAAGAEQDPAGGKTGADRPCAGSAVFRRARGGGHRHHGPAAALRRTVAGRCDAPRRLAAGGGEGAGRSRHPAGQRRDAASGGLRAGHSAGRDPWPRGGRPDPPRRGGGYRRRCSVRCAGQRPGRAGRRCGRSRAAPAGRQRGKIPHRAVLAGLWRLGHRGAAAGGRRAGHGAPGRAVRHRYQPDDPPQKRDRHSGGQRPSGQGTSGRVRALCAAHPLRIQKEGKDLCK